VPKPLNKTKNIWNEFLEWISLQDIKSTNDFDHQINIYFQVSSNKEWIRTMNPGRNYYKRDQSIRREIYVKVENQEERMVPFWQTALAKRLSEDRIELYEVIGLNPHPIFRYEIPPFNESIVNAIRQ